jgi:hypothetical protein
VVFRACRPALQPFSGLSSCARAFPRNRVPELLSIWRAICEGIFAYSGALPGSVLLEITAERKQGRRAVKSGPAWPTKVNSLFVGREPRLYRRLRDALFLGQNRSYLPRHQAFMDDGVRSSSRVIVWRHFSPYFAA